MFYTGIGARETPKNICNMMTRIAIILDRNNYILRSGGADGADSAFELGVKSNGKEIYLPWKNFNTRNSPLYPPSPECLYTLKYVLDPEHMKNLKGPSLALHMRNVHQVLGKTLDSPSEFVICWTQDGKEVGGTATAIKVAKLHCIPVYNLAKSNDRDELKKLLTNLT